VSGTEDDTVLSGDAGEAVTGETVSVEGLSETVDTSAPQPHRKRKHRIYEIMQIFFLFFFMSSYRGESSR
ncbi:MAG: hypothetical protein ACI4TB_09180, partial [Lachnospiraceae bacterium]